MAKSRGSFAVVASLLLAAAHPHPLQPQARQTWTGITAHDFSTYGCKPIILIFARETIGPGNMGDKVGPQLSNGLKLIFGPSNVATEGVDYLGLPETNFVSGGAPPVGIGEMQVLLTTATSLCPTSIVVASGYSQGAALTHRAIEGLSQAVKDRIAGVVTFGDTQTLQDGEHILGFPLNKTLIICNAGDVICAGTLWVVPIHFDYTRRVPEAVAFLVGRIEAAGVKRLVG
ncbi:cutinase-domain-containing protein [Coniochaeta ligniaria NRRL 30616]|uniref:Cutinase n=1 Tax=Coniochaeta ligniaria NRRL 30616 TaxID=1408157 RepID=A0A1J7JMM9_9PEZI|nr:cutinase-domain-containing protein [Coniochaeta ligniaria NRRL 30616]